MLKNNTDIFCSCSNYSSHHVCVKKINFCSNYVSDNEYVNENSQNICKFRHNSSRIKTFLNLEAIEVQNISFKKDPLDRNLRICKKH